ncbi:hypothetical protein BNJ_00317 [Kaumoebavirus]|uniref:hypothetical protein n=1 Tax=Kaumoebavirus TaxID=1859492 RepID=UPI0009C3D1C4|nr:hypothetical protein BNJ_00317 [Kaumoebavirus]ARA72139.1 hypothetical protein BNJ_00317 [Kaumoebavirus]
MELIPGLPNETVVGILQAFKGNTLAKLSGINVTWMHTLRPMIRRIVTRGKLCPDPWLFPNVEEIVAYVPHRSSLYNMTGNDYYDYRCSNYYMSGSIYADFAKLEHITFRYYHPMEFFSDGFAPIIHVRSPHSYSLVQFAREMMSASIVDTRFSKRRKYKDTIAILNNNDYNYSNYTIYYASLVGGHYKYSLPQTISVIVCNMKTFIGNMQKIVNLPNLESVMVEIDTKTTIEVIRTLKRPFKELLAKNNFVELNHAPKSVWMEDFDSTFDEYVHFEMMGMQLE